MNEAGRGNLNGLHARAAALVAHYERAGYARVEPAILQPAEPFLDLSGEDIRRRMYLTAEPSGRELCLRPDLTIPVSRDYLASEKAGEPAGFCYLGPVFRQAGENNAPGEFLQAGIESFGRRDTAAADAEMLARGLEATAHYGVEHPEIRMGDVGLFAALIEALDLPPAWRRRLIKDFNRTESLEHDLDRLGLSAAGPEYQGLLAALAGSDLRAAHALVTDLLSIAGITTVGGRSVGEIADRFLEQAAFGAGARLPQETRALVGRFLKIAGDPDEAAADLRALAKEAGLALDAAIELLESRTGFLAVHGIDTARIRFSTAFGRGLDYYTGFVFELHDNQARAAGQLVAGGRYDGLLSRLGAENAIPAVGFAVWIGRLQAIGASA
jgi:ATP phosphoribosyltransferase regulatory subunit